MNIISDFCKNKTSHVGDFQEDIVYLDNSATTKVNTLSAEKALYMMTKNFGNPSSLHRMGIEAEKEMEHAREVLGKLLGCDSDSITFTSGGTESNNLAIFGAVRALKRMGNHIITTTVEHPSVAAPIKFLENNGYEVTYLSPEQGGEYTLSPEQVLAACRKDTVLISIMAVNNEIGTIFPVEQIAKTVKRQFPRVMIHCDAVQSVGKRRVNLRGSEIDLLSFSGHKMHAPKGVGGLYVKKKVRALPIFFGGGQEKNLRSGTESTPLIAALGVAAENLMLHSNPSALEAHFVHLHRYLVSLLSDIKQIEFNSDLDYSKSVPYIINFSVKGIRSEIMLHHLASKNVFVSSGSACARGKGSHVLQALGLSQNLADSALRVSFCENTTTEEIDRLVAAIKLGIEQLLKS